MECPGERKTRGKKLQGEDRQVAEERKLWTKTGPVRRSAINQPLFGENCKRKAPGASVEEARSHKALSLVARASLQPLTGRQFGFCFRGLPEQRGGDGRKEKQATVRGGKARKLCSEQDTMVLRWRGDTLCFSIIFNYFLKAATAFDAHTNPRLDTQPSRVSPPLFFTLTLSIPLAFPRPI